LWGGAVRGPKNMATPSRTNLASLVSDFDLHPRDLAIVAPRGVRQRRVSYSQLATLTRRFAAELARRSILKGDRVLIWGENGPEWVAAFFGCILRGVVPVPVDCAGALDFVARVEREVSPKCLTGDAAKLALLRANTPRIAFEDFASHLTSQQAHASDDLTPEDTLQIIFTSGTTGDPKGVVHTHRNVLASLAPIEHEMRKYLKFEKPFHPIRILHTLPLSHVFGQFMGLWTAPLLAAELHYQPRLVAAELAELIRHERISVVAAVPRVLDLMQTYALERFPDLAARVDQATQLKAWQRWWQFRDVHRFFGLKFWAFVCGGAALSTVGEQFWSRLGFVVVQGYGMTETTALVSLNHPFHAAQGTIGQVLPGREVRLGDDGEVLVRGDTISNTTWQHGQIQRQPSEWLATGDLATFDEAGNLQFRGRKKDVIVTSAGLNIYPEDLEAAFMRQPGVKAVAVIETDAGQGPEARAVLVMQHGVRTEAAVVGANRELAEFQQIRHWAVWPEADFPRTSTGKILKREVARRLALESINSQTTDLNLDSLGRVQLQAQLEQQYGIALDDSALQNVATEEDVRRVIEQAESAPTRPRGEHFYWRWPWNPPLQFVRAAFLELIAMPLVRLLAKPKVVWHATRWPASPALIVCNHLTSYDAPFILYALPGALRRRIAIAMAGEMLLDYRKGRNQGSWYLNLLSPFAYWLITGLFNVFPLPQYSGFRRSFQHAGEAVDRGYSVVVFPEGRRSDDGNAQPFKVGAGLLWKDLGSEAIPVRIDGLGELKLSGGRWFRSGTISVVVGEPLRLDATRSPEELTEQLRQGVFDGSH
jgi:long-chain acyl-CoA synthetase